MTVDTLGRALAAYRRTTTSRSAMFLIAANAIPVVGVLFFGWSLLTILVLYWLENGIVGFWNIPKIALAHGSVILTLPAMPEQAALAATGNPAQRAVAGMGARGALAGSGRLAGCGRTAMAAFFLFHYGMFWFVHGIFVFALPAFCNGFALDDDGNAFGTVNWESVAIAGVALFLSHGASFLFNYIGRAEYLTASPATQMGSVYGRVVVLHLTIIFGSFLVAFLGAPIGALLVLVILKTAFDLGLHLRERRAAAARMPEPAHPA
ncbi:MAG: DUF6498-containing protein [Candidatus Limnocylindrales bacterium]